VAILTNLDAGSVLFIDEIHRLNRLAEEFLYPAMEDFEMDMVIGRGPSARTVKVPLPRFTLIGRHHARRPAHQPLRDRFGIVHYFEFYSAGRSAEDHHPLGGHPGRADRRGRRRRDRAALARHAPIANGS
jgi:Holliday junction DNA helicase RuvB